MRSACFEVLSRNISRQLPGGARRGAGRAPAAAGVQLASPAAAFTTGATWDVNGGLFMR